MCLIRKQDKSKQDIKLLLNQNKNLVYFMLSKSGQLQNQDAESAAWEALWDAINLFDVYAETEFSTFACTVIKNKINDVLRKQKANKIHTCQIEDILLITEDCVERNVCNAEEAIAVLKYFDNYLKTKQGMSRNVLLAWESTLFESNVSNIAIMCGTTASYVSRVQCAFRAYLHGKLRG